MKKKTGRIITNKRKAAQKADKKHKNRLKDLFYADEFEDGYDPATEDMDAYDEQYDEDAYQYEDYEEYDNDEDVMYADEEEYDDEDVMYADEEEYDDEDVMYADEEEYDDEDVMYADEEEYDDEDVMYADEEEYDDEDVMYADEDEYDDEDAMYADDEEQYLYAEYDNDEEYQEDDTYYAEDEEDDFFDVSYGKGQPRRAKGKKTRKKGLAAFWELCRERMVHMTPFDYALTVMTILVFGVAVVAAVNLSDFKDVESQMEAIVPVGTQLSEVGIVGESGLLALANAKANAVSISEEITELETESEPEDAGEDVKVSVSFESVEKDLKIRFRNAETGSYIQGTAFEVTLTSTSGKTTILKDDDMDGIIYVSSIEAGSYQAVITSTEKYQFPAAAQKVTVKNKVEYVVVNVDDEVKKETQVNVSVEDTAQVVAKQEEVKLTDTVEWVESSKTAVGSSDTYTQVDKSTIADPSLSSSAKYASMKFDALNVSVDPTTLTLQIGANATLTAKPTDNVTQENTTKTYEVTWQSSDANVAVVEGGKVTAKAAGTATITCKIKETVVTKVEKKGEDKVTSKEVEKTISEEEYNNLSEEEKSGWNKEEKTEGETLTVIYKKTVTEETTVPGETTTQEETTTNEGSATCTVTVEAAKITSAALELTKSADSCTVGTTMTVSPSKLVYTKTDSTTETITSGFPTIIWTSSDANIAKVDEKGVVTGVKAGTATITGKLSGVKDKDGKELDVKATTTVTIKAPAALSVALDAASRDVKVKDTTTLVAMVSNHKSDNSVTWTSSDTKLATVNDKGVVTTLAVGKVTITATTKEKDATTGKQATAACVINIVNSAMRDTTSKLKDKNGSQIYIKGTDGNYQEAVYADYYTASAFFVKSAGSYVYTGWQTIDGKTYYYDKNGKAVTGTQIIKGVTYNFGADGAIQTSVNGSTFGIDVSKWNGKIDFNAVKASGVDYVIIRCGYRGSSSGALIEDPYFKQNIQGATAAGLKVGIYFFSQAVNEVEAVKEASFAIERAKGYKLTYPIFIDTEPSGGRADGLDKATRTAVVNAFCKTVTDTGYQAGIYASKSWFESKLQTSSLSQYKIWLAQYAAKPTYAGRYDMWQYSHKGTISGINGNVDLNYSYLGY